MSEQPPATTALPIDYGALMREALRGVLRGALQQVAREGLQPPHHFVVAFATGAPDVVLSPGLHARYPEAMTIVLEHRFADLEVSDEGFGVTLWFGGAAERLWVPFAAVAGWADPGAGVSLQIGVAEGDEVAEPTGDASLEAAADPPPETPEPPPRTGGNVVQFARPHRPTGSVPAPVPQPVPDPAPEPADEP